MVQEPLELMNDDGASGMSRYNPPWKMIARGALAYGARTFGNWWRPHVKAPEMRKPRRRYKVRMGSKYPRRSGPKKIRMKPESKHIDGNEWVNALNGYTYNFCFVDNAVGTNHPLYYGNQVMYPTSQIGRGTGTSNRIGAKIQLTSIQWRLQAHYHTFPASPKTPANIRLVIGFWKNPTLSATQVPIGDVYEQGDWSTGVLTQALRNPDHIGNFKIIHDELIELDEGYVAESSSNVLKMNKIIQYTEDSTDPLNVLGNISKNAMFFCLLAPKSSASTTAPAYALQIRIRWLDV
nr:MAG TPA: capsid protein [Cressdnaviricota sp.]